VNQDDRVVVHVDHAGFRRHSLCDFVGIVRRRNPGSDVEELADSCFTGQVADCPGEEGPVRQDPEPESRSGREHAFGGLPVGGEIVLAAEPVVVNPGRMRDRGVDPADRDLVSIRCPPSRMLVGHSVRLSACPELSPYPGMQRFAALLRTERLRHPPAHRKTMRVSGSSTTGFGAADLVAAGALTAGLPPRRRASPASRFLLCRPTGC
jgi:hypothetical protein